MQKSHQYKHDRAFGICLGASTISAVEISQVNGKLKVEKVERKAHEGNPKEVFQRVLEALNPGDRPVMITGRKFRDFVKLPSITEPEAIEYALDSINSDGKDYDAVVSAGGETFMVYRLDHDQKVSGISTGNKCASGTGEFFLQQIKRMDLSIDQAVKAANEGKPYSVSGRCSVFCKSDCTHALNKGEPISDVTAGLCKMIGQKVVELLAKVPHDKVLVVGGTALNNAVIKNIKNEIPNITVPEEAAYFEALGASIAALDRGEAVSENLFDEEHSSFSFLPKLKDFEHLVTYNEVEKAKAQEGDRCIVGLDVGSTTTKAVLMRESDHKFLGSIYLRTNGNPVEASRNCYKSLMEQIGTTNIKIVGIGVTGSGRQIAGLYSLTDGIINEIIAHASAAIYFDSKVDTIFEIGGQDAKYTYITNSVASDYAMNEACSAGTGSFLEEAAWESLGVKVTDIADLAVLGERPPNFNDQCAAFISSDIKNATHEGISRNDILAGLVYSICLNYVNRVKGHRPVGEKVFVQGGVCYNKAVPLAMASILQKPIVVPPEPGLMGAFGVALEVKKRIDLGLLEEKDFDLGEIINRAVTYDKPFTCAGGKEKCDIGCSINRIRIEDKLYPFGGACNKYYNQRFKIDLDADKLDLVRKRNELLFDKYAPATALDEKAKVIGINRSFLTHRLFPMYYNFFTSLGFKVVMPKQLNEEALNRQASSMCFPAQIAIGYFDDLIAKKPDFYFMPHVEEMHVAEGNTRKEFSATCIFVQGEGFWMKQIYKDKDFEDKILSPTINFSGGWKKGRKQFLEVAEKIGSSKQKALESFNKAIAIQEQFEEECREIGRQALVELKKTPDKIACVILGRPYNSLAEPANKGIPKKFATRGVIIFPFDMIPYDKEPIAFPHDDYMHWEIGQQLLRTAQVIKREKQLYGVFITNFLCAIDSLLVSYFRRIMASKPSLTLELDGHTADAGVNTRIEAFLDIIKNYIQVQKNLEDTKNQAFQEAKIEMTNSGAVYVDSAGDRISLMDPRIKVIVPSMGDLSNRSMAAVLKKLGIDAEPLPIADAEVLRLGRGVTTCKECLPMIICIGSMLKYLKHRKNPDEKLVVFQPRAAGYCRFGQYHVYMNILFRERKIRDVATISLANEERYAGLGPAFALPAWMALTIGDVFDDIRNTIMAIAVDKKRAMEIFEEEYAKVLESIAGQTKTSVYKQLRLAAKRFKADVPTTIPIEKAPHVVVMGEIFVRRDAFSNQKIAERLAQNGFVTRISPVIEWVYYLSFMTRNKLQVANYTLAGWLEFHISEMVMAHIEKKVKKIMAKSHLYEVDLIDIDDIVKYSKNILPKNLKGEPGLITGIMMRDALDKYAGVINIGPFGCMPVRFTEAVASNNTDLQTKIESYKTAGVKYKKNGFHENERIPFLTIEADGNPYPQLLEARFESFCLQATRIAKKQGKEVKMVVR